MYARESIPVQSQLYTVVEVTAMMLSQLQVNVHKVVAVMLLSRSLCTGVLADCIFSVDPWRSNSQTIKCWNLVKCLLSCVCREIMLITLRR